MDIKRLKLVISNLVKITKYFIIIKTKFIF